MGFKTGKYISCNFCAKEIYKSGWELKKGSRQFCSRACAGKAHSMLLTKHDYRKVKCPECEKEFQQHWKGAKKYCSTLCASRHNLAVINAKEPSKKGTKPEKLFAEKLHQWGIFHIFQKSLPWKKGWKKWFDFYIPEWNMLIEIDGEYWHGKGLKTGSLNKQQWNTRKNDRFKNYLAKKQNYNLVRLWSTEVENLTYEQLKNYNINEQ